MNIQRFHAPTAREALAKARMTFGDGTLILSNRPVDGGVEVVATAEDSLPEAQPRAQLQPAAPAARPRLHERAADLAASPVRSLQGGEGFARSSVAKDTEKLAMSTLSFQDYVRERMLRRRHEALHGADGAGAAAQVQESPAASAGTRRPAAAEPPPARAHTGAAQRRSGAATAPTLAAGAGQQNVMHELQAMKELIEERFNTLAWLGQARQNPVQSSLMLKLIRSGYSPALARAMLEHLPESLPAAKALQWLMQVLERNLRTDALALPLHEEGGIHALVGATGVGKTTTAAKLAAMCARTHGPGSVGLITLDTYRVGAHEQLRQYGRMLGVVAHLAHDRAALQDLLGLLSSKKMVLIDTTGAAPRDPRLQEMLQVLDLPDVNRLLVLNACSHGDTFDDVLTGFKSSGTQQAILSKTDEAVKLGPAIDALVRHQMVLRGVTCGQRVPEDWEAADARQLVAASMRSSVKSAFDPREIELNYFFTQAPSGLAEEAELADVA
ncbi:flagellar biosynthesis protein FlhF [Comamonas flocculans]|uniref:Flagellar biosynthesis protein FlhF n=1 Tax=Comamonas flocculans TaxID=2597701 RepID=A0A5B8RSG0_9BURK|nr:flagellar biosynthesis protein FlhF [Comamonas flocculans]QEA12599.1 flagellar biosynthesis protein FlhF [Comamonas flocculans]